MGDGFDAFCTGILNRPIWPGDLAPTTLAEEFVRHFGLQGFPVYRHVEEVLQKNGVGEITPKSLPEGLRGIHGGLKNGGYTIHYKEEDWTGGRDHTVLHETYEILQEKFADLCPPYYVSKGNRTLCRRADRFAAAVLMQKEMFTLTAEMAGLDVVALQRFYRRSYASVALRLAEVMRSQPLLVAIYERQEEGEPATWEESVTPDSFAVSLVVKTPGFPASRSGSLPRPFRYPAHLLPRKGDRPVPGSSAYLVIEWGHSVQVERVAGYDLWSLADLTILAQPVYWYGRLAKVVLVAVPWHDRGLLESKVPMSVPYRVETAFQII